MDLITENKLRELYKKEKIDCLQVSNKSIITPSAKQYMRDKQIQLVIKDQPESQESKSDKTDEISKGRAKIEKSEKDYKYQSYISGAFFSEKPEAMTQIFGNQLVYKDHPIIELRGKIDSLESSMLEFMLLVEKKELPALYTDLNEVLNTIRSILAAEVRGEEFKLEKIISLSEAEIRERSHYPQKYYGIKHILPGTDMGEVLVGLNRLRSSVREVEIAAVKAFHREREIERVDIIKALNRMSSVFYVMMCKYQAGEYN
ncbi:MAG: cobalamin adenosyltransferase [bacterium]